MKQTLWVFAREPEVTVLGPGVRYGLWVSGCSKHCPGCISSESRDMYAGTAMHIAALCREILDSGTDGITISGGEPFLQSEALAELLRKLKKRKDFGVIVYSGYTIEQLHSGQVPHAEKLLKYVDLLIDGEYQREENDGGALRGSSNQRAVPLTERYLDFLPQFGATGRRTQKITHASMTRYIGIPDEEWK